MTGIEGSLPPLKALQAFEAVARHGSVTMAARELNVTQSAVSHQIRNLEEILNTRLFDRHGPKLIPTSDGELLFQDLSKAIHLIKRSVGTLRAVQHSSTIGLWVRPHFAMNWLASRVQRLSEQYPGINLFFSHSNQPADFSDPGIHASIEWRRIDEVDDSMTLLIRGNLTPACHPDLLTNPGLKSPSDLSDHTLLHETDESVWQEWLRSAGVPALASKRAEYYEDTNVRQQVAVSGGGVVLVCPALVEEELEAGRIVLPFDHHLTTWSYYLVIPEDRMMIPNVRRFANWIVSEVGTESP